jgi:uncharacterized membrane protein
MKKILPLFLILTACAGTSPEQSNTTPQASSNKQVIIIQDSTVYGADMLLQPKQVTETTQSQPTTVQNEAGKYTFIFYIVAFLVATLGVIFLYNRYFKTKKD